MATIDLTSDAFEKTVTADGIVMVDFWAEWCQPCKMLTPTIEELAGDFEDQVLIGKLNVDDNPNTATTYGIRGIPTLLFITDGQVAFKFLQRTTCSDPSAPIVSGKPSTWFPLDRLGELNTNPTAFEARKVD